MFQNITQIVKSKLFFNDCKWSKREAKSQGRRRLWHYFAVKKLSALLRRITSKHHGDFYCLNFLHFFATEKKT